MIINFSHQKGGVGKSTLAYNLTQAYEDMGKKVTLYDLDIQDSCLSFNALREIPKTNIKNVKNENQLMEIVENSKEDEISIIDSGGFDDRLTRLAIIAADVNITPLANKVSEMLAMTSKYSEILEEIEKDTKEEVRTFILLNRIHLFTKNFQDIESIVNTDQRMSMYSTVIRDRGIYDKSLLEGLAVQEAITLKGHEDAKSEMQKLANEILETLKNKG